MKKLIVCGALAAFALGTQAATVVGDGVYKTKVEAESAVKTTKVCTEQ